MYRSSLRAQLARRKAPSGDRSPIRRSVFWQRHQDHAQLRNVRPPAPQSQFSPAAGVFEPAASRAHSAHVTATRVVPPQRAARRINPAFHTLVGAAHLEACADDDRLRYRRILARRVIRCVQHRLGAPHNAHSLGECLGCPLCVVLNLMHRQSTHGSSCSSFVHGGNVRLLGNEMSRRRRTEAIRRKAPGQARRPLVRSNTAASMLMATNPTSVAMATMSAGSRIVMNNFSVRSSSAS